MKELTILSESTEKVSKGDIVVAFVVALFIFSCCVYIVLVGRESAEEEKKASKPSYTYMLTDSNGNSDGFSDRDGKSLLNLVNKNVDEMSTFPVMVKGTKIGSFSWGEKLHEGVYEIKDRGDFYTVRDHVVFASTDIRDGANFFAVIKGKDADHVKKIFNIVE